MSLKYRDINGEETSLAGLNGLAGDLIYGVSTTRSGTYHVGNIASGANSTVFITFDEPVDSQSGWTISCSTSAGSVQVTPYPVAANLTGFYCNIYNGNANATSLDIQYIAFKLYTNDNTNSIKEQVETNTNSISTINDSLTDTDWITLSSVSDTTVQYRVKNGFCTVVVHATKGTFNNNGTFNLNATLPSDARPSITVSCPAAVYGYTGDFNYNRVQNWINIPYTGVITIVGGIVNGTTGEIHATVTYPVG